MMFEVSPDSLKRAPWYFVAPVYAHVMTSTRKSILPGTIIFVRFQVQTCRTNVVAPVYVTLEFLVFCFDMIEQLFECRESELDLFFAAVDTNHRRQVQSSNPVLE